MASADEVDMYDYDGHFVDDMSGQTLKTDLVLKARKEEMDKHFSHNAYDKVPIEESHRATGKGPIGSRWIDINKGDVKDPIYRSRLVARKIKRDTRTDLFAATPPLEAMVIILSLLTTRRLNPASIICGLWMLKPPRPARQVLPCCGPSTGYTMAGNWASPATRVSCATYLKVRPDGF